MKYAIISDIHGNLEAFQSVLSELKREKPDRVLFLGDVVGYGANPNQSIELLREVTDIVIAGNHDHAAVGLTDITYFNPYAKEAILWTRNSLSSGNAGYLKGLPFSQETEGMTLVHSSPKEPEKWHYMFGAPDVQDNFDFFDTKICFIGHTHAPLAFIKNEREELTVSFEDKIRIEGGSRYLINAGSVGQPRDGDNRAAYVLFDTEKEQVEFCRIPYDIKKARDKIIKEGIPESLGYRLEHGR